MLMSFILRLVQCFRRNEVTTARHVGFLQVQI